MLYLKKLLPKKLKNFHAHFFIYILSNKIQKGLNNYILTFQKTPQLLPLTPRVNLIAGFGLAICNLQFSIALWRFVSALLHFFWKLRMVNNVLQLFLCILYKIGSSKTQLTCVFVLQLKAHNFVFYMLTTEKTLRC